ncbi:hypothetical protein RRG08_041988 [Elysia crispata]|uniref:Uncharacterized protein n=1 Tax=Elysia crispata TaxID=231223 RepID=A0AAE0YZV5_9GAST|nr:hypothetical protein RRG08_041988 [Elysia crispata]
MRTRQKENVLGRNTGISLSEKGKVWPRNPHDDPESEERRAGLTGAGLPDTGIGWEHSLMMNRARDMTADGAAGRGGRRKPTLCVPWYQYSCSEIQSSVTSVL